jgi:hypothetical protein
VFSVGADPRLHNEDPRPAEIEVMGQSKTIEKKWQRVQLRVEIPAVKRRLYVCCSTMIFGVCDSVRLLQFLC